LIKVVFSAEPEATNCLSYPVIYADGAISPRGTFGVEKFDGASAIVFTCGHDPLDPAHDPLSCPTAECWEQQDPWNEWQAESQQMSDPIIVDWIDWGDNLEARPWTTNSIIRVETSLYKQRAAMLAYRMMYIRGEGMDEMWGTTGETYEEILPAVYASDAQLTAQYLPDTWDPESLVWNPADQEWTDPLIPEPATVVMNEAFSAEVNVKGKVIHGNSWNVNDAVTGEGLYRITMSFGPSTNTIFDQSTQIMVSTEESSEGGTEPQGGVAVVDVPNNLTYIDVLIEKSKGSGGGGGNGPGGPGGGGSGGGGGIH